MAHLSTALVKTCKHSHYLLSIDTTTSSLTWHIITSAAPPPSLDTLDSLGYTAGFQVVIALRLSVSYAFLSMNFYDCIDGTFPAVTSGLLTCLGDNVLDNGTTWMDSWPRGHCMGNYNLDHRVLRIVHHGCSMCQETN